MKTLINLVLDESGSMSYAKNDTITGFNQYVREVLEDDIGEASFTFTKFNSNGVNIVHSAVPIVDVNELDGNSYNPSSGTPLFDAIGKTVETIEEVATDYDQVLFVIMTDGQENDSREYKREDIQSIIKGKEEFDGWTFVFLGADQDAWGAGSSFGISSAINTYSHSHDGYASAFADLSAATHNHRVTSVGYNSNFFAQNQEEEDDNE